MEALERLAFTRKGSIVLMDAGIVKKFLKLLRMKEDCSEEISEKIFLILRRLIMASNRQLPDEDMIELTNYFLENHSVNKFRMTDVLLAALSESVFKKVYHYSSSTDGTID